MGILDVFRPHTLPIGIGVRTELYLSSSSSVVLAKYIRRKEKTRRSGVGMDVYRKCAKFQGPSLKNGVDIWTFAQKSVY